MTTQSSTGRRGNQPQNQPAKKADEAVQAPKDEKEVQEAEAQQEIAEPTEGTVTFELPKGMSKEEFEKAFKSFQDLKGKSSKISHADGQAISRLKKAHAQEFHNYRVEEWKKAGLDATNIKMVKA